MSEPSNGTSTVSPRPSRTTTGSHTHSTSNQTVALPTSDAQPLTQDGGNSSDIKIIWLSMIKERLLLFKEVLTTRTETLSLKTRMERHTKDGESSMLMSTRRSQLRVNSTRSSDFTLRETSTLFQHCQMADIST